MVMAYWLVKSEPDVFSWDDLMKAGKNGTPWTGVRNHGAKLHLSAMKPGERVFYYHSNADKAVVGIAEVVRAAYPDPTAESGPWVSPDIRALEPLKTHVTLAVAKADPALKDMVLVNNTRLSVQPVSDAEWKHISRLGGVKA
jgi:predicted RNA-binding protein with PUA-like domain